MTLSLFGAAGRDVPPVAPGPVMGYAGRRVQLLTRPLLQPRSVAPFIDVDHVVDHLATLRLDVDYPGADSIFERDRVALVGLIRAARNAFLSPGGGLLAVQSGTPRRWWIIHARSGARLTYFGDRDRRPWTRLRADHQADLDLSDTAVVSYVDTLEGLADPRGLQIDWTADIADLQAQLDGWHDYVDTGELPAPGTSTIFAGMSGLHLAAVLHASSPDPMREAATSTLARAVAILTYRADSLWIRGRHAGLCFAHLAYLDRLYNHGRRRAEFDSRTREQLRADRDTGKVVTLARLYAFGGQPHRAVTLLRQRADVVQRDDAQRQDGLRSTALVGAAWTLADLFSPACNEFQRLRHAEIGDLIVDPAVPCPENTPPRHVWRITRAAHNLWITADGHEAYELSVHEQVDDRRGQMHVRPGVTHPIGIDYYDDRWSHGLEIVGGGWALLAADDPVPTTSQEVIELARSAAIAFDRDNPELRHR